MIRSVCPLEESVLSGVPAVQEDAGFGALETAKGRLPLKALSVRAQITGLTAKITVRQTFRNSLGEPLEATYIFPLPDRAAVTSFRMEVAGRVVEGELKERAQARAEYQEAIQAGHRAALAEEDRSGTFHLRVGNIPPQEDVTVELVLIGPLPVAAGEATFRFPLVVAPRYVPGMALDGPSVGPGWANDTDQAPDASRVTPPVLLPGFPNPVQLSLEVELDPAGLEAGPGDWADRVRSSLHSVITDSGPPWTVRLQPGERLNRDFILRFPAASDSVQTSLQVCRAKGGEPGTFALVVVPPAPSRATSPKPRDVVFVLDRSGSMEGWKMVAARRAVGRMLDTLLDQDRFAVLAFDNVVEYGPNAGKALVEAGNRQRWRSLEWLGSLDARGGTEMGPALAEAVRLLSTGDGTRQPVLVLVTDGQVAGEDVVLRTISQAAGRNVPRIHTLGIDRAVNAGFLRRLADLGQGTVELVESEDQLDAAMDRIHRSIGAPALSEVRIEPLGFTAVADSVVPSRLPDVFADRPVTILGRWAGSETDIRLRVCAVDANGKPWGQEVASCPAPADVLLALWGRAKVRELEDRYAARLASDPQTLAKQIVEISLATHVLSRFTAYVAVDRSEVVNPGGKQQEIVQPVEPVEGWDMLSHTGTFAQALSTVPAAGVVRMACMAPPSERGPSLARRAMPMLSRVLGGLLGHAKSAPTPTLTLADHVDLMRTALEDLAGRSASTKRRQCLATLIERLEAMVRTLQQERHAAQQEAETLLRRAVEMQSAYDGGNHAVLDDQPLAEFLDAVRKLLDKFSAPPGTDPRAKPFWT